MKKLIIVALLLICLLASFACGAPPSPAPMPSPVPPPTPSPTPESYPMVKVDSYAAGSAERAFAEFLTAWKNEDWDRMAEFTQITWRSGNENPAQTMWGMYEFKDSLGAEIVRASEVSDCQRCSLEVNITFL